MGMNLNYYFLLLFVCFLSTSAFSQQSVEEMTARRNEQAAKGENTRQLDLQLTRRGVRFPAKVKINEQADSKILEFVDILCADAKQVPAMEAKIAGIKVIGFEGYTIDPTTFKAKLKVAKGITDERLNNILLALGFQGYIVESK